MIYASGLNYGQNQEEMLQMDNMGFPYACYYRTMDDRFRNIVPWHWHRSIEIDYVTEGSLLLTTSEQTLTLHKGDICFINSGVLHTLCTAPRTGTCSFYAHLFHASFLSGMHNSQIEQNYLLPILGNAAITACRFPADTRPNMAMLPLYHEIITLDEKHPFGYEFTIREALSKLWLLFFQETLPLHDRSSHKKSADNRRIKEMIQYIHDHYEDPLTLGDIAAAAGVSRQECMRCFRKYIHTSPVAYLTQHRIRIAAGMLLHTDLSIITISENCGFGSNSYFSKVFRNAMGCTPKEYRNYEKRKFVPDNSSQFLL
ncbi:MAG: AraC family transcriptional regulator, partial [Lachnospiraceae bacterium]|nr:AraC family transcriptional regulator [Lachnospiraceae bacterium]